MDSKTIIVFSELIDKIPNLQGNLDDLGLSCQVAEGGRQALEKAQQLAPAILLLDVAMPEMSGIECCRQIKEGAFTTPPKIILVSSLESSGIEQRAEDAGCDRYILESEAPATLGPLLSEILGAVGTPPTPTPTSTPDPGANPVSPQDAGASPPPPQASPAQASSMERRGSPRVDIPGPVLYTTEEGTYQGAFMNLSLTGLLFAAAHDVPVGTLLGLRFRGTRGLEFELKAKVVRTMALKTGRNGLGFGVGAMFERGSAEDEEKISWLLDARLDLKLPQFSPEQLRTLLDGREDLVAPVMRGEAENAGMEVLLGQKTGFESTAFQKEDHQANCVRRLVFLRAQLRAFRAFVPVLAKNRGTFAGIFLPLLPSLFDRADAIEEESNALVREAVEAGDEAGREGINKTSNALYDARVSLVCALADHVSPDGLGEHGDLIRSLQEEASRIRSRQTDDFDQKYSRRAPVPEPKQEAKETDFLKSLSSKKTWIKAGAFLFIVLVGAGAYFLAQRVSPKELQLGVGISSITKVYNGVDIEIPYQIWANLPEAERGKFFDKLEAYMAKNRYKQSKILADDGRRLAVIMGVKYGKDWVFRRRFY